MTIRLSPAALLLAGLTLAAGCDGKKPTGTLSGTVTYNGKPLTMGSVNFLSPTGAAALANLDDAGHYKVEGAIEAGEYTVYLNPPIPGMAGRPGASPRRRGPSTRSRRSFSSPPPAG